MPGAGEPLSIRLPVGIAARIRELTGRPAGEIIRTMALSYVERLELDASKKKAMLDG